MMYTLGSCDKFLIAFVALCVWSSLHQSQGGVTKKTITWNMRRWTRRTALAQNQQQKVSLTNKALATFNK